MKCKEVNEDMGHFKIEAIEEAKGYSVSVKTEGMDKHLVVGLLEAAKLNLLSPNESSKQE